jgi:hypothetical protein
MQVTQQQAVPYQFFQGNLDVEETTITWPDQYEGMLTAIDFVIGSEPSAPILFVTDASDVPYVTIVAVETAVAELWTASWSGAQVVPSGSVIKLEPSAQPMQVAVSGWLLSPPGSVILAE